MKVHHQQDDRRDTDEGRGVLQLRGFRNSGTCNPLTKQQVGSDNCYTVEVEVRDGLDTNRVEEMMETDADAVDSLDDSITVKIGVRDTGRTSGRADRDGDVARPRYDDSGDELTKLNVTWHADNTGPDIDHL